MSRKAIRFICFLLAGFAVAACKKENPYEDHVTANRIKIIIEPSILEALQILATDDGGAFLIYGDTLFGRRLMKVDPSFVKTWSFPLPAFSSRKMGMLEMADHSLFVIGGNKNKDNFLFWYHVSASGKFLDSAEIGLPIPTDVQPGPASVNQLIQAKDGSILIVGGLQTFGGSGYAYSELIPFSLKLDPSFKVLTSNTFYLPIPNVSHASYSITGLSQLEDDRFLMVGNISTNSALSAVPYHGFFSGILDRDGKYISSKTFQTGLYDVTKGDVIGFSPQSWQLFPDGEGHFATILTPILEATDKRCRIVRFDPNGNYVDSTFFYTSDFLQFNDVIQKPGGGYVIIGAAKYPSFGIGINFKKESLLLNISETGNQIQFLQPAYTSSNSFVSCCLHQDGHIAMFGDVLNPQDRQINLILVKLDENGLY